MVQLRNLFLSLFIIFATVVSAQSEKADSSAPTEKPQRKVVPGNHPALVKVDNDGKLHLLAANGEIYGKQIAVYEPQRCIGWWTSEGDHVVWQIEIPKAGKYDVSLEWAITDEWANNKFIIEAEKSKIEGVIPTTGGFENYKEQSFGTVTLPAGKQKITMRAAGPIKGELADLRRITLTPIAK